MCPNSSKEKYSLQSKERWEYPYKGEALQGCWLSMLHANHPLRYIINGKHTLKKSCCLHCFIVSPQRVRPQLTPEEDFGMKSKCLVKF